MADVKSKSLRLRDVRPDPKPRKPAPVYLPAVLSGEGGSDDPEEGALPRRKRAEFESEPYDGDESRPPVRRRQIPDGKTEEEAAYDAALKILSYGANTRSRLFAKLAERGFSEEAAGAACEKLTASGLLNDRRELDGAVLGLARRFGPERIPAELKRLGFGDELIDAVDYEALGIDFVSVCRRVIEKKGWSEKTAAYLKSHGFTASQIRRAGKSGGADEE